MIEIPSDSPEYNRAAFLYGIAATVLMLVVFSVISLVIEYDVSSGYDSGSFSLGTTDGVQSVFIGKVLGGHGDNYCEVDVSLKTGSNYEEVIFFECDESLSESVEGVNWTWDEISGDFELIFDTAPEAGSEVMVGYMTEPDVNMPASVMIGFIVGALVFIIWLASAGFAIVKGPHEYAFGVGATVIVVVVVYFVIGFYLFVTGCGIMC